MPFFRVRPRRQKVKVAKLDKKELEVAIQQELAPYIKREELLEYLKKIEQDEKKKKLWDSLPVRKKIKLLRYLAEKKGVKDGKKQVSSTG